MPKLDFKGHIANLCYRRAIELYRNELLLNSRTVCLTDLFDDSFGKSWSRRLKMVIGSVQKQVNNEIQSGAIDPSVSQNPGLFVVNSIVIHATERLLVKAGAFESIGDLRRKSVHEDIHNGLTRLDYADELDDQGGDAEDADLEASEDESPIIMP